MFADFRELSPGVAANFAGGGGGAIQRRVVAEHSDAVKRGPSIRFEVAKATIAHGREGLGAILRAFSGAATMSEDDRGADRIESH